MRKALKAAFAALEEAQAPLYARYELHGSDSYHRWADLMSEPHGFTPWRQRVWVIAMCGNYCGSDIDAVNQKTLIEEFGSDFWVIVRDSMGAEGLAIVEGRGYTVEAIRRVTDFVRSMSDEPLLDEEAHSEFVNELANDAWDDWVAADLGRSLNDLIGQLTDGETVEDEFKELYYGYGHNEWVCESATTIVNMRHVDAVRHAIHILTDKFLSKTF